MVVLFRAANSATWSDCASFAETEETTRLYLDNPGFGGNRLWRTEVEPANVLDLSSDQDAIQTLADLLGLQHPGAIGVDEWVPRVCGQIQAAGYDWVRVQESYPQNTVTWVWVGPSEREPELEEA